MDHRIKKQTAIEDRRISRVDEYPALWRNMMTEWLCPEESDRAWLLYAANYLLRTGGVQWALDPLTLRQRVPETAEVDASLLQALDYVVLTHGHADHLDINLLRQLREFPVRWVIPDDLLGRLQPLDLPESKIIPARPMESLQLGNLRLTPFEGLHREVAPERPSGWRGPPATGYLAEFNGKRWLFPGDTRTYDASQIPPFKKLDGLVAHVWLGRGQALQENPPLLDAFCRFCVELGAGRIVLTHLEEFKREVEEYWDDEHAEKIMVRLHELDSRVEVSIVRMGESFPL